MLIMISLTIIATIIGFVIAIVIHESAHGYVADLLGDSTARIAGRITLNPIKHIDPVGSILIPGLLLLTGTGFVFGWAKPVPVNPYNFRKPQRDRLLVALAGPVSNFLTACVFAAVYRFLPGGTNLPTLLIAIITINLVLMMFNLIPIPPLDGSAILPYVFKNNAGLLYSMERQGFMYLLGLLIIDNFTGGLILGVIVRLPVQFFLRIFLG
jgi:Zn-dependent protease